MIGASEIHTLFPLGFNLYMLKTTAWCRAEAVFIHNWYESHRLGFWMIHFNLGVTVQPGTGTDSTSNITGTNIEIHSLLIISEMSICR